MKYTRHVSSLHSFTATNIRNVHILNRVMIRETVMGIRALCAAAAVVVGVGSAAEAATTVNYELWLRYEGTNYTGVLYDNPLDDSELPDDTGETDIPIGGDWLGLSPRNFPTLISGQIVKFTASVLFTGEPIWISEGNGGRAHDCNLAGNTRCSLVNDTLLFEDGRFYLAHFFEEIEIYGTDVIGQSFEFSEFTLRHPSRFTSDGKYSYYTEFETSLFTVVPPPSPVPLPATAALLPLGIGALAVMRKRQRTA